MAEYKYRALGWKDDDIASLNVVDGTASDNQVELQITKQGAGTIDGPAIVGKDGITIGKAADSEKIEISGKGCVQHYDKKDYIRAYIVDYTGWDTTMIIRAPGDNSANTLLQRKADGSGEIVMPETPVDLSITNKKYVDDNYVKLPSPAPTKWSVLVYDPIAKKYSVYPMEVLPKKLTMPFRDDKGNFKVGDLTADDDGQYCANKKYVDDADKGLRLKLSNLEQSLNGYILDTTEESYADLDSAVLKDSVAVGDNVYPIADKTRALVTRIEGKTTKMVQLLDKSKFPATSTRNGITFTNNGDGTITANGTVTEGNHALIKIQAGIECIANHKYLIMGCPEGGLAGRSYGISIQSVGNPIVWDEGKGNIFSFDSHTTIALYVDFYTNNATYTNKVFTPQLFDLTAMNREDITTVEQFKAEFPEVYPYENGNIYPAKISGVKFTGKNLFNINQFERYNPSDTADIKVINDKLSITGYPINLPNNHYFSNLIRSLKPNTQYALSVNISNYISDSSGSIYFIRKNDSVIKVFPFYRNGYSSSVFSLTQEDIDTFGYVRIYGNNNTKPPLIMTNLQIEENSAPTAYEPYTEPVFVTLPETYDLHGIGDYKDYLEITKNEDNELYTLKKVQVIDKHIFDGSEGWSSYGSSDFTNLAYRTASLDSKFINWRSRASLMNLFNKIIISKDAEGYAYGDSTAALFIRLPNIATAADMKAHVLSMYEAGTPYIFYGAIATPVETVIATNLTYEQVTAIRHNGGLIEVEGNTNKGYARPTVTNTIVYRLTAANTVEG